MDSCIAIFRLHRHGKANKQAQAGDELPKYSFSKAAKLLPSWLKQSGWPGMLKYYYCKFDNMTRSFFFGDFFAF